MMTSTAVPYPNLGIFFSDPGYDDYPFTLSSYRTSYRELAQAMHDRGGQAYIVREQSTYLGQNRFARGWKYSEGTFQETLEPFTVDIIYNKGYFVADTPARVLNVPAFDNLCTNKSLTAKYFSEYSPVTVIVDAQAGLREVVHQIPSELIVAKPLNLQGGEGILIGPRDQIIPKITTFPYLIQEFIDTSMGIPGLTPGLHDFRLVSVRGTIVNAYLRIPKKSSYIANAGQGGTVCSVELQEIPQEVRVLFKHIDRKLSQFTNRVYSIDLGRHRDGRWMIIELNSKPGLLPRGDGAGFSRFHDALIELFMDLQSFT